VSPQRNWGSPSAFAGQQPAGNSCVTTVTGDADEFVAVSSELPGCAELVMENTSFGGLKNVMRLEVNEAADTVTSVAKSERPGAPNGPRLTHVPSPGSEQSALVRHAFLVAQSDPRTT
jgi:hypothetical protein